MKINPPYLTVLSSLPFMQHIITQDFARNQDPPPVSSSASATFQSSMPSVSSSGRTKGHSRYSPENQGQASHHQRSTSRVSPENAPDKPRARYTDHPVNYKNNHSDSDLFLIIRLTFVPLCSLSRPGKSPERSGRQMENYEPISPPQSYQGMEKPEAAGHPPQRREAENSEIRYGISSFFYIIV